MFFSLILGWAGTQGNGKLDPQRIRGWRVELAMDAVEGIGSSSSGTLLLDHLACVGTGDMLGAAFRLGEDISFADALQDKIWMEDFFESEISEDETTVLLTDGKISLDYTLQHTQTWGGFLDFTHIAPGAAYYNLSLATDIFLEYEVHQAASVPGRAHFRLVLQDSSHCEDECDLYSRSNERYYSFHYILDDQGGDQNHGELLIPLEGSRSPSDPFWLTGKCRIHCLKRCHFSEYFSTCNNRIILIRRLVRNSWK